MKRKRRNFTAIFKTKVVLESLKERETIQQLGIKYEVYPYKYPYLLRGLNVTWANQVWQIDISFVPMQRGFMYLVSNIDVQSRYIVVWSVSNTMDASWVVDCLKATVQTHVTPEIINSDQGSQFTGHEYIEYIKSLKTDKISMDGKGCATEPPIEDLNRNTVQYLGG